MHRPMLLAKRTVQIQEHWRLIGPFTQVYYDIKPAAIEVKISGVRRKQLIVSQTGSLGGFIRVYACEDTTANALCLADVKGNYPITYVPHSYFVVHLLDHIREFHHREKLFAADWHDCKMVSETKGAKETHKLPRNSVHP